MDDLLPTILHYVRGVWLRRWSVILVAWLVCISGWFVATLIPSMYTSSTRIHVDTSSLLNPLLSGIAVDTDIEGRVAIMQETLLSRPNLEKVARATDLDHAAKSSGELDMALARLAGDISISSPAESLFVIGYNNTSPELAKRVVEALLATFVEGNLGAGREEMGVALRFLDEQIAEYQRQLEVAERRLSDFKAANLGVLSDERNFFQKANAAQEELNSSRQELQESLSRREALQKQLGAEPRFFESSLPSNYDGPPTDEESRILELEKTLDGLLSKYTDKHPDVITVKRRLDELRKLVDQPQPSEAETAEGVANGTSSADVVSEPNPVYDQVKLQLLNEEANIATIESRIEQQEAVVTAIEQVMQTVPQTEQEHTQLTRDVESWRGKLEDLLKRRESARLSQQRETVETVQFRIVDPPSLPTAPSGPNRALFLMLAFVAGIGSGVAFGLALVYVRDGFSDARRLKQAFSLPVLGSVSLIRTRAAGWASALAGVTFLVVCACLPAALAALLLVNQKYDLTSLSIPRFPVPLSF